MNHPHLTPEELAGLFAPVSPAREVKEAETAVQLHSEKETANTRQELLLSYLEKTVRELRRELLVLQRRVDELERRPAAEESERQPGHTPSADQKAPEPVQASAVTMTRSERQRSDRAGWFR